MTARMERNDECLAEQTAQRSDQNGLPGEAMQIDNVDTRRDAQESRDEPDGRCHA